MTDSLLDGYCAAIPSHPNREGNCLKSSPQAMSCLLWWKSLYGQRSIETQSLVLHLMRCHTLHRIRPEWHPTLRRHVALSFSVRFEAYCREFVRISMQIPQNFPGTRQVVIPFSSSLLRTLTMHDQMKGAKPPRQGIISHVHDEKVKKKNQPHIILR